jgi:ParB family chromosome partitioning protein
MMSKSHNPLGRGLGALIQPTPGATSRRAADPADRSPTAPGRPLELAVDEIRPNPDQPRRTFDAAQLEELTRSIVRHGVLQPVVVRQARDGYELVVGERRWRACQAAGKQTIPAVVADIEPEDRLAIAIVENVQRNDLNPLELAHAFHALTAGGATQEEIGESVSLARSTISNHLRLLDLSRELQTDVERGRLTMGHAKALLQLRNPERQLHLRDRILRDGLSVRAAEELARSLSGDLASRRKQKADSLAGSSDGAAADPNLQSLLGALRERLQTQVRIQGDGKRGRIEIEFFSSEDLDRLSRTILGAA